VDDGIGHAERFDGALDHGEHRGLEVRREYPREEVARLPKRRGQRKRPVIATWLATPALTTLSMEKYDAYHGPRP